MRRSVTCSSCGAKIREGRERCLRCGEPLQAVETPTEAPGRGRASTVVAAVLLSGLVALLILGVMAGMPRRPAAVTVALSPTISPRTVAPSPAVPAGPSETDDAQPGFLDTVRSGNVRYARGDFASAAEQYRQAVDSDPGNIEALNNLGQVLVRLDRVAEAVEYLRRGVALAPDYWALRFNLARAHAQLGEWPQAVAEYRQAIRVFPDDYATHYNLGLALHKQGDEAAAVEEFKKAIELAPIEPTFHLSLGISYEQLKRPLDAAGAYARYLELAGDAPDAERVRARIIQLTSSQGPREGAPPAGGGTTVLR